MTRPMLVARVDILDLIMILLKLMLTRRCATTSVSSELLDRCLMLVGGTSEASFGHSCYSLLAVSG